MVCILCLISEALFSQNLSGRDERASAKAYHTAARHLQQKDYAAAISHLRETIKLNPFFIKAHQQLGDCLRLTGAYEEAGKSYRKVLELAPGYSSLTTFGLAASDFYCGSYESALLGFRKYLQTPSLPASSRTLVEKHINDCIFSIQAIKEPKPFAPVNLGPGVNSAEQEYFPVATAGNSRLIFTRRTGKDEDLYESVRGSGSWLKSVELDAKINTADFNEGSQSISPDGNYLFYSGCNKPDGQGRCDIYISKRTTSGWSEPYNPGAPLNTGAWESQPSVSANGGRLYFVSDRKGGYGANDIWYSDLLEDGKWSEPINAGANINSPYDEHSPFIYPDNKTLYFSSNGWPGFGKQDIFVSRCDESGNWQKPENLGSPVNTAGEQSGLMISTDGVTAYFASERPEGLGGMDIYSFALAPQYRPDKVVVIESSMHDAATSEKVEGQITVEDFTSGTLLFEHDALSGPDMLAVLPAGKRYTLRVLKKGYMPYSENISIHETMSAESLNRPVTLKRLKAREQAVLNNIFFETDQYTLLPASKTELNFLVRFLTDNPSVKIEIGGHTDSEGTDEWNLTLSENRAKEVYKYLLANKIDRSRLSFKGYGRTRPIAGNKTEEGKQQNRRTSFTIQP
jgi:outer membrane protein OmpA-like peptidoglycan-associated protein